MFSIQDEDDFRLELANDWIQQERFNIQEAFTNQTKKIHADFQSFIQRLDQEFEVERQRILSSYSEFKGADGDQRMKSTSLLQQGNQQFEKQFKSNTKRHMLMHTAPVMDPSGASRGLSLLRSLPIRSGSSGDNRKSDVSEMQQKLDQLQAQTQGMKEVRHICV